MPFHNSNWQEIETTCTTWPTIIFIQSYNPNSNEVGTLCKTWIKTEYNDLQILFNLFSIEYTSKIRYLMFKLINLAVFWPIFTHLEFDASNMFQKSGTGATKDWESWGMLKKHCLEHSTGEQVHWKQVSVLIGYKRSFPESRSQARMGRGSPLCEQLREQIVQQFENNVSQCAFARNVGIWSWGGRGHEY